MKASAGEIEWVWHMCFDEEREFFLYKICYKYIFGKTKQEKNIGKKKSVKFTSLDWDRLSELLWGNHVEIKQTAIIESDLNLSIYLESGKLIQSIFTFLHYFLESVVNWWANYRDHGPTLFCLFQPSMSSIDFPSKNSSKTYMEFSLS